MASERSIKEFCQGFSAGRYCWKPVLGGFDSCAEHVTREALLARLATSEASGFNAGIEAAAVEAESMDAKYGGLVFLGLAARIRALRVPR